MSALTGSRRRACGKALMCLTIFLLPNFMSAQEVDVTVRAGFLYDSLKIGEETAYYLASHYPSHLTVLFPDSTHAFTPFEYTRREYFPTETTGGVSVDSAVYYLTTFEVDRVQSLSLPVYVIRERDSTTVKAAADTILITQFVAEVPDTVAVAQLPLKMNTAYQKVSYDWNFWMFVMIVTVIVAILILVWLLFGKRIKKYFQARRLQKNYASFVERYDSVLRQLQSGFSAPATESALAMWKRYMEQLESRPYTKLTTRETLQLVNEPVLSGSLSNIDRAIYGHEASVVEPLENLKTFADQQYRRKLKEVQHG